MPSLNSPIYTSARERRQICAENRVEAFIFPTIHRAPRGTEERGSPSPPLWKRFSTVHVRTTNARRNKHVCSFFSGNSPDSLSVSSPLHPSRVRARSSTSQFLPHFCVACAPLLLLLLLAGLFSTRHVIWLHASRDRGACGATNNVSARNTGTGIHMPLYSQRQSDGRSLAMDSLSGVRLYREPVSHIRYTMHFCRCSRSR